MRHDTLLFLGAVIACAWGAACIAIICQGLRDPPVAVPPPAASAHLPLPRSATEGDAALVRAHVGRLTDYLDSLRARDPSRYQRLSAARPGLFDSLNEIQHILSPQNP